MLRFGLLVVAGSLLFATPALAQTSPAVTVERVVDGDTIEVNPAVGGKEDVRLIGVDTPETVDPNEPVQPYGTQASAFTKRQLEGKRVTLIFDQERTDQYDRALAYVRLSGQSTTFNETLLRQGYAQLYIEPPQRPLRGALRAGPGGGQTGAARDLGAPQKPAVRARQQGQRHRRGFAGVHGRHAAQSRPRRGQELLRLPESGGGPGGAKTRPRRSLRIGRPERQGNDGDTRGGLRGPSTTQGLEAGARLRRGSSHATTQAPEGAAAATHGWPFAGGCGGVVARRGRSGGLRRPEAVAPNAPERSRRRRIGPEPRSATGGAQEGAQRRSWWRRVFGG
jgi:endonuclease YncB( thermonuclease family)